MKMRRDYDKDAQWGLVTAIETIIMFIYTAYIIGYNTSSNNTGSWVNDTASLIIRNIHDTAIQITLFLIIIDLISKLIYLIDKKESYKRKELTSCMIRIFIVIGMVVSQIFMTTIANDKDTRQVSQSYGSTAPQYVQQVVTTKYYLNLNIVSILLAIIYIAIGVVLIASTIKRIKKLKAEKDDSQAYEISIVNPFIIVIQALVIKECIEPLLRLLVNIVFEENDKVISILGLLALIATVSIIVDIVYTIKNIKKDNQNNIKLKSNVLKLVTAISSTIALIINRSLQFEITDMSAGSGPTYGYYYLKIDSSNIIRVAGIAVIGIAVTCWISYSIIRLHSKKNIQTETGKSNEEIKETE